MRITVIGASGLIGSQLVELLRTGGHEVVPASRQSGVDVLTGEGLAESLAGAEALVDVLNSPSFADDAVMEFFTTSTTNIVAAAKAAGVGHYVALSIVGTDGLPESGYLRAKTAQEKLIVESGMPYSILRATQFIEFADTIVGAATEGTTVRVPDALIQPVATRDVVDELALMATADPLNRHVDIGGPDKISFADLARTVLARSGDTKEVVADATARYFGTPLEQDSLVTGDDAIIAPTPMR